MKLPLSPFLIVLLLLVTQPSCSQSADTYVGLFTNKALGLSVHVNKQGDTYNGFFELQQKRYPFTGTNQGTRLYATYDFQQQKIPFTLYQNNGIFYLNSEGYDIELQHSLVKETAGSHGRQAEVASNTRVSSATGKRVTDPYGSYSFLVPQQWSSKEEQGSFVLTKEGEEVGFSIVPHNFTSKDQLWAGVEDVIDENSNTNLKTTAREFNENGVFFHMEGVANGQPLILEIITLLSPYGGGVSVASGGLTHSYTPEHTALLKTIAGTVKYTKTAQSPAVQQWTARLNGKQLIYLHTGGGGSEKITLNLFADGQFSYASNSAYFSDGGGSVLSYAGRDGSRGTWKVQGRQGASVLVLYGEDKSVREYILTQRQQSGEINLNDRRYFIRTIQ